MLTEWSVECGPEDPVLVVPWSSPDEPETLRFVDLRTHPDDLDLISEADSFPALMHALRALNAVRSPVFTAKCDAWELDAEETAALQFNLDPAMPFTTQVLSPVNQAGFGSYIDVLWRDRSIFTSLHQHEQILHRLARHAAAIETQTAALECTVRPAFVDLAGPQEGFAVTFYVKALGDDVPDAQREWARALEAVTALLRGKDLSFAQGSS